MPRKKPVSKEKVPGVHNIRPRGVYNLRQATRATGMATSTLEREMKKGRIRVARRGGKVVFLGRWLIRWMEDGAEGPAEPGQIAA